MFFLTSFSELVLSWKLT